MIICFDLDGTILDNKNWTSNAIIKALKKHNINIKKENLYPTWGVPFEVQLKNLFPKITKNKINILNKEKSKIEKSTIKKLKPFKGSIKFLRKLKRHHVLVIASNNTTKGIKDKLKSCNIPFNLFDLLIGMDKVKNPKPSPDILLEVKKILGKNPDFMVGDTKQDIIAANKAKITSVLVTTGPNKLSELKRSKPSFTIKKIQDLEKLL